MVQVVHPAATAAKVSRLAYLALHSFMQVVVVVVVTAANKAAMDITAAVADMELLLNMVTAHTRFRLTLPH